MREKERVRKRDREEEEEERVRKRVRKGKRERELEKERECVTTSSGHLIFRRALGQGVGATLHGCCVALSKHGGGNPLGALWTPSTPQYTRAVTVLPAHGEEERRWREKQNRAMW